MRKLPGEMELINMRENKPSEHILEKAADLFDLPGEVMAGMLKITVTGGRRAHIENHKGILEYGDEEICVNGGKLILKIRGSDLELRSMNAEEMLVTGFLTGVDFEY